MFTYTTKSGADFSTFPTAREYLKDIDGCASWWDHVLSNDEEMKRKIPQGPRDARPVRALVTTESGILGDTDTFNNDNVLWVWNCLSLFVYVTGTEDEYCKALRLEALGQNANNTQDGTALGDCNKIFPTYVMPPAVYRNEAAPNDRRAHASANCIYDKNSTGCRLYQQQLEENAVEAEENSDEDIDDESDESDNDLHRVETHEEMYGGTYEEEMDFMDVPDDTDEKSDNSSA